MKSPLYCGVKRAWQAIACAMIIVCLLLSPTSAQAQSVDERTLVLAPGVLFNPIESAGVFGSTPGCDTSAGGFFVGHQAAQASAGLVTSPIGRSLANLHDRAITIADRKVSLDEQGSFRRRRGRRHGDRALLGLVFGAVGGFVAGGAIGAAVSAQNCHCANPELHGFIIGAPIGAVVGGFLGYALATR
jgi:hypothetical protein